ncbi:unnamed protein product [Prunus brigantina]
MLVFIVVLLCQFLESRISFAADTITANQSLSGDQTIVSGDFELGFFEFDGRHYIGTWYSGRVVSASTIVWVANREIPISDRFSSVLNISDGNLVLFNEAKTPVWSTHLTSTTTPSSVQAVLLDSGNLVLRAHSSSSEFLWQSFDHPTHTWLPGAKIGFNNITNQTQILTSWKNSRDPAPGLYSFKLDRSNSYILLWNRSKQYWTSGPWNASSNIFSLLPYMRNNYIYNYSFISNENGSYLTYSLYDPKKVSPTMMPLSGQIQQLIWYTPSRPWKIFWSEPRQQCAVYAMCGAFGSCNEKSGVLCNCLMGFEQKSPRDWALQDYSGGCQRKTNLQCGNSTSVNGTKDQFLEMHSMSMPENKLHVKGRSTKKCESICLNNCSCTAYAYESSTACSIWIGDLLGVQELVADDAGGRTLYIRLAASELMHLKNGKGDADKRFLIIAMVSAAAELLTIIFCYLLWKKRLGKRRTQRRKYGVTKINYGAGGGKNDTELPLFSLKSILNATNNFSEANKLGEGGFGPVYKGILPENQEVAIKRLSKKSGQGHEEFMNELNLIAKLQHTNLVRLLGCCIEEEELILIYEFMPHRSLDKLLFDPSENAELDWGKRFRIIEGVAQGVLYIHKYSRLKIIHRDLKASNVLLDGAMNPKISDFGMAKIFEINQSEANTNRVVGTYGYMSPEYARYGHFSEKLDVFSFGVLLLEIVSGKRNAAFYRFEHSPTLAGWAWELWKEGRGMEVIDASVRETSPPDEALKCIHVGFLCVQEAPADRPTMASVICMLQSNEATSLPPSKEPAFSTNRNSIPVVGSSQLPAVFSNNGVTITMDTKTSQKFLLSVIFLCLYMKTHVCLAADTITANQPLSGDQTIVSAGGVFELGFFKPSNSSNYYIGIWYKKVSVRTVVWVANREQPISDRFSSVLKISDGNLLLFSKSKGSVWSTSATSTTTTSASGSVEAVLLDSGNLVLRADGSSASTKSEPLWQSFDHPADTWLPGSKIRFNKITKQSQILTSWKNSEDPAPGLFSLELDPNVINSFIILQNRSQQSWTSGSWDENSDTFSGDPDMTLNSFFNYSYVTNENESYFTYSLYNPKITSRLMMNMSGQVQQLTWLEDSKQWNLFWSKPKVYAYCGPFSSYNEKSLPLCSCLMGFEPKSPRDWSLRDYSDGCSRKTALQCWNAAGVAGTKDGFLEMPSMSLPDSVQDKQNIVTCRSICSSYCDCTAYAYSSTAGCSILTGDLFGLKQLAPDDGDGRTLYIRLAASEFKNPKSNKELFIGVVGSDHYLEPSFLICQLDLFVFFAGHKRSLVIATVSATAGLLTIIFCYFLWKKTWGNGRKYGAGGGQNDAGLPLYRLRRILAATNNFSEANKLGEGGFGPVYKGILPELQEVAIKRLSKKSGQGHEEFMNELKLIAKLQHTNLVRLLGCCIEKEEMILIYEYMLNRSLDKFLFDPLEKTKLDWGKRFQIIEGIAQGLLYIHKYSRLKIIHRDLKASNVLLDGSMNPKISDFGMARIFGMNQTEANTNRVVGTYGYMSPEYALYGHFSEKLDVFSFGVLLLEIVSGKKNASFYRFENSRTLAGWAWELWKEGRGMEVIDESVREACEPHEALKCMHVGFLCVQEDPADRPTMSSVFLMLQGNEAASLPLSKEPAFSMHRNYPRAAVGIPAVTSFSNNVITMSIPEGR